MKIVNVAVDRSTSVFVLLALIIAMGVYSYVVLPRESAPEVIVPFIVVSTGYEGVSPEDIESLVTLPIERKLTGISGVKEITSNSLEGRSQIVIEFAADTDIDSALQKVRDKVDQAKQDLPDEADDPSVTEINLSEEPILIMCLTGNLPLAVLDELAEDLEDRIEAIEGVLDVEVIGGVEREIQIEVDPDRVAQYGVSFANLITLTMLENVNTPGGTLDLGEAKFLMRTPGEFKTPDELTGLVVKQGPTGTVYLRDIATVKDGFKEPTSLSRVNGTPAVTLAISKRSGENIIKIADRVRADTEAFLQRAPKGVKVAVIWDESDWIRDMVSELENSMLSGLILVVAVVFIALGFVNAIFVSLAIPISMMITLTFLYMSGVTLNMVVLFSLILALGMLVDNGIVVIENIHRHFEEGVSRVEASKTGAAEVAWPIIASTLTTVAAFVPMFFWPGIFGEFMFYLPETLCLALMASLFVGMIVNPALASRWMPTPKARGMASIRERSVILRAYGAFLRLALRWRGVTITLAVVMLVVVTTVFFSRARVVFMPEVEPPQAYINIECPEGTNLETSDQFVRQVEAIVEPYRPYMDNVIASVGWQGVGHGGGRGGGSTHLSRVTLDFPKLADCKRLPSEILAELRDKLKDLTGAEVRIAQMEMGPPTGPPVNVEISGEDFPTLAELAEDIKREIKDIPGLVDVRDDYNKGKPEVKVIVDRQQAWKTGLNTQFIGLTIKAAVEGRKAGDYREGDEQYDVMVRFPKQFRSDLANIMNMNLINLQGQPVPFSAVARIEEGAGLGRITRIDRKRVVTVSGETAGGRTAQEVLRDVRARLKAFPLPAGYAQEYTGENEDMVETQAFLSKAFVVAVMLVALVIVAQFNSIAQTLIIMTTVILSLTGVFLGLLITNMPFGVLMTGIGCISLAGVVVNNGIVFLDFINQLRARGLPTEEAIVQAGMTRFRPVLLTAITTVLGLIPMAVGISFDFFKFEWVINGDSAQWWGSMAVAVSFGLSFATLLTLVVVPTLYSLSVSLANVFARQPAPEPLPVPGAAAK